MSDDRPTSQQQLERAIEQIDDPVESYRAWEALEELVAQRDAAEQRLKRHCRGKIEAHAERARAVEWLQAANARIQRCERTLFEIAWGLPADTAEEYARQALGINEGGDQ